MISKLLETIHLLTEGNENGAVQKLQDLLNQIEALREKKLSNEQADFIVFKIQTIINLII